MDPCGEAGGLSALRGPTGSSKARFFRGLGYTRDNAHELHAHLLEIAGSGEVTQEASNRYGTKYVVEGYAEARTIAVLTLSADDLRSMDCNEILHARRLTPAHN